MKRKTKRKIRRCVSDFIVIVLFLTGSCVLLYPHYENWRQSENRAEVIEKFNAASKNSSSSEERQKSELYLQMQNYNERIYSEGQLGMTDAWSNIQGIDTGIVTGFDNNMIGYVSIPAIHEEIPLYLGADEKTLHDGAAVLAETSMPIGGINTNCVIAAHRGGYNGQAMFREIEVLKSGDLVQIKNPWETLSYEVVKSIVISPDDLDAVRIIPDLDLVTLITCHPYGDNRQRYVVYCRRMQDTGDSSLQNAEQVIPYEGADYVPSEKKILMEDWINRIGFIAGAALLIGVIFIFAGKMHHRRKQ